MDRASCPAEVHCTTVFALRNSRLSNGSGSSNYFFTTHKNKETTLYFAPYAAGKGTESSGPNCI